MLSLERALLVVVLVMTALATAATAAAAACDVRVSSLRVLHREVLTDATCLMGVDESPRFAWALQGSEACVGVVQQGFVLTIVSEAGVLASVDSASTAMQAAYPRDFPLVSALAANTRYTVHLTVKTSHGDTAKVTGCFHTSPLWSAKTNTTAIWIGGNTVPLNQLRKEFSVASNLKSAVAVVSGIGYYTLFLNGQSVDDTLRLDPAWTTYQAHTLYTTQDVTALLQAGGNAVGVMLGNGWFSQDGASPPAIAQPTYGPPRLYFALTLTYTDGSTDVVVSDLSWTGRQGPIIHDGVYAGETYDARMERSGWATFGFADKTSLWLPVEQLPAMGALTAQLMEPVRILSTRKPVSANCPVENTCVYDFGQNMAGWARVSLVGPRGVTVRFRYAEVLQAPHVSPGSSYSGMIYTDNLRGAIASDTYIYKGSTDSAPEIYEPMFTYHGFRYLQIEGFWTTPTPDKVLAVTVGSAVADAGTFNTSSAVLNQIQSNVVWGQRSNLMSLPTDCNQRDERKGWSGDAALTVGEACYNFKMAAHYVNHLRNIADAQSVYGVNGSVPDTVPWTYGSNVGDPAWGTVYPSILFEMYRHYSDIDTVQQHYDGVRAWVDYLISRAAEGLANMYFNYGDWVPPPPVTKSTSQHLTSSYYLLHDIDILITLATVLNNTADAQKYGALYTQFAQEFHTAFYNPAVGGYDQSSQTANSMALALRDVVPDKLVQTVFNTLVADIVAAGNHLSTGILGTKTLLPVLCDHNRCDLAVAIASQTTYPSWGYMFNNQYENATTIWELWDAPFEGPGMNSRNHIMFGTVGEWFYRYISGIRPNADGAAFFTPHFALSQPDLTHAETRYAGARGDYSMSWQLTQTKDTITGTDIAHWDMTLTLPPNTDGVLVVPATVLDGAQQTPTTVTLQSVTMGSALLWRRDAPVTATTTLPAGVQSVTRVLPPHMVGPEAAQEARLANVAAVMEVEAPVYVAVVAGVHTVRATYTF